MSFRKVAAMGVASFASALALSGCLATETDIYIGSNAQVTSLETVLSAEKEAEDIGGGISTPGISSLDEFKEAVSSSAGAEVGLVDIDDFCVFGENETAFTLSCAIDEGSVPQVPISELLIVDPDGGFVTEKRGSEVVVTLNTVAADPVATALGFTSLTRIHMPGQITSLEGVGVTKSESNIAVVNNAKTNDGTITITSTTEVEDERYATAVIILSVFFIAILVFLGGWMLASKKRDPSAQETDTTEQETL